MNLSVKAIALLGKCFLDDDREFATLSLTEECGNSLPLCEEWSLDELDRIRFAAIKISNGNIEQLDKAINVAKADWRDLLVWADFAENTNAHNEWADTILRS